MTTPALSKVAQVMQTMKPAQQTVAKPQAQPPNPHQAAPALRAPSTAKPPEAKPQAPKLQTHEFAGGKIFELEAHNVHNFLAVVRGHEGRFMELIQAQKWILAVNHHQGFDENGKKYGRGL